MKKNKKHAAPLRCKLDVWFRGPSPSRQIICRIGGRKCRKCKGCKENIWEVAAEENAKALTALTEAERRTAKTLQDCAFAFAAKFKEKEEPEHDKKER